MVSVCVPPPTSSAAQTVNAVTGTGSRLYAVKVASAAPPLSSPGGLVPSSQIRSQNCPDLRLTHDQRAA